MQITRNQLNELYRYAWALCANEEHAYDLVHNALVKLNSKSQEQSVAYLKVVVRNLFIDQYRKQRIEKDYLAMSEDFQYLESDLEHVFIQREDIRKILQDCDPEDREILYQWAVEEKTFDEIASETNQKLGTLLSRVHRIKNRIRQKHERA